jgi:ubiquinone/menaquinone biosynthesis C-methylase UbiE
MTAGDNKRQSELRQKANQEWESVYEGPEDPQALYLEMIRRHYKSGARILDVGCGTGHMLTRLSLDIENWSLELHGLDLSPSMIELACQNNASHPEIRFHIGDESSIPFPDASFDIVLSRLADFTPSEIARVLGPGKDFIEYGLGPHDSREIAVAFGSRYICEFLKGDPSNWFTARSLSLEKNGLATQHFQILEGTDYLSREELEDTIEMVPLVANFCRLRDKKTLDHLSTVVKPDKREPVYPIFRQTTLRIARKT